MDAANMLKPMLARGELRMVGATTLAEYRKIERDGALARRFSPVTVEEPSVEEAVEILHGLREAYEDHHRVEIADEALLAAARLSDRYIPEYRLPDKAIDLVDQAAAKVRLRTGGRATTSRRCAAERDRLAAEKQAAVDAEEYEEAAQIKTHIDRLEQRLAEAGESAQPSSPRSGRRRGSGSSGASAPRSPACGHLPRMPPSLTSRSSSRSTRPPGAPTSPATTPWTISRRISSISPPG